MRANDRIPIYEQQITNSVASDILGREAITGGSEMYYKLWTIGDPNECRAMYERVCRDNAELYRCLELDMIPFLPYSIFSEIPVRREGDVFTFGSQFWRTVRYNRETNSWAVKDSYLERNGLKGIRTLVDELLRTEPDTGTIRDSFNLFRKYVPDCIAVAAFTNIYVPTDSITWLLGSVDAPELLGEYLDARLRHVLAEIEVFAELGVDVLHFCGDLCGKNGPIYSPEFFRKVVVPRLKKAVRYARSLGLRTVYNTDGNTWPIADALFLETGIDEYMEIDYSAGMKLREIRQRFPSLTLVGNVPMDLLVSGTAGKVKNFIKQLLGGGSMPGHILASSNTISAGVKTRNFLAMIETARSYPVIRKRN